MIRPLAFVVPTSMLLALPASAHAETLIDTFPAWSAWLGGGSALLLIVALAFAVGSTAKEPYYARPRRFEPMPLYGPGGSS